MCVVVSSHCESALRAEAILVQNLSEESGCVPNFRIGVDNTTPLEETLRCSRLDVEEN